jgi:fructose-1,6-bisphosphatase/inositol monophosphatase family enzyme
MVDPEQLIDVLRRAARQAGAVALHLQGKVAVERKEAGGLPESEAVTGVDRAAQDVLLLRLHEAFPDVAVDAEESTDAVALFPPEAPDRSLVVLDPVDGTLAYTRGSRDWAVMGALIERGRFVASLVAFPCHDLTCWAMRGGGAWLARGHGPAERIARLPASPDELLVAPLVPRHRMARLEALGLKAVRSRVSAVDSTAPALGRARASVTGDTADRRRALGFLITLEAGGAVRFGDRAWDGEDPVTLDVGDVPTVAADSASLAERIVRTVS